MIEKAIYYRLFGDDQLLHWVFRTTDEPEIFTSAGATLSQVLEIVGVRIYAMTEQKGILPSIVYKRISSTRPRTLEGASGLVEARFQITCRANKINYRTAKLMSRRIKKLFDNQTWSAEGYTVVACYFDSERDGQAKKPKSIAPDIQVVTSDYLVWYREATASGESA